MQRDKNNELTNERNSKQCFLLYFSLSLSLQSLRKNAGMSKKETKDRLCHQETHVRSSGQERILSGAKNHRRVLRFGEE